MANQMPWNDYFSAFTQNIRKIWQQNPTIQDYHNRQDASALLTPINKSDSLPGPQRDYNQQYWTNCNTAPTAMTTLDRRIIHIGGNSKQCDRGSVKFSQTNSIDLLQGSQGDYNKVLRTDLPNAKDVSYTHSLCPTLVSLPNSIVLHQRPPIDDYSHRRNDLSAKITTSDKENTHIDEVPHVNNRKPATVSQTRSIALHKNPQIDNNLHQWTDLRTKITNSYRQNPCIGKSPQRSSHDPSTLSQTINNGCNQLSESGCNQQGRSDLPSSIATSDKHSNIYEQPQMSRHDAAPLSRNIPGVQQRNLSRDKPFKCEHCPASFSNSKYLKIHLRIHSDDCPFKCEYCSEVFPHQSKLTRHLRKHTGERPHVCEYCNESFSRLHTLKIHLRTHTGVRPYKCDYCGKSFTQKANLDKHRKTRIKRRICSKVVSKECNLTLHYQNIHTDTLLFKCQYCSLSFSRKGVRDAHQSGHTDAHSAN